MVARELRARLITVDGEVVKNGAVKLAVEQEVKFDGNLLAQQNGLRYFMLNTPQGYVCSTDDPDHPTWTLSGKMCFIFSNKGFRVVTIQLSVVHRLPQSYRWLPGFIGIKVEPIPLSGIDEDNCLIGLKLLSHKGTDAWRVMRQLNASLQEIQIDCAIVECEGELACLCNTATKALPCVV